MLGIFSSLQALGEPDRGGSEDEVLRCDVLRNLIAVLLSDGELRPVELRIGFNLKLWFHRLKELQISLHFMPDDLLIVFWMMRDFMVELMSIKKTQWILTESGLRARSHQPGDEPGVEVPMKVEDVGELDLSQFADEFYKIAGLTTGLVPDPNLVHTREPLDHGLIAFPEEEMNLMIREFGLDGFGKVARKDGVTDKSSLNDENIFRLSVCHKLESF